MASEQPPGVGTVDIELGDINSQPAAIPSVNFSGYHDSEPGAPHDPNHVLPTNELPPRPPQQGRDWKALLTKIPWSALGSVASAVAGLLKKSTSTTQNAHIMGLYSIIGTLTTLLGLAIGKLGSSEFTVNIPGLCDCKNATTTIFETVTANLTSTSSSTSRSATTIVIVPTITSHVIVTKVLNHTATVAGKRDAPAKTPGVLAEENATPLWERILAFIEQTSGTKTSTSFETATRSVTATEPIAFSEN
jgi:hypothetical protein